MTSFKIRPQTTFLSTGKPKAGARYVPSFLPPTVAAAATDVEQEKEVRQWQPGCGSSQYKGLMNAA